MSVYQFTAKQNNGEEVSLGDYQGKVLLIVNTASRCGFTDQYEGLEKLYRDYKDQGLEVLGFPCNQFGEQEPGSNKEIAKFCQINYDITFPLFSKVNVNGEDAHPLYDFLKEHKPGMLNTPKIKWNFTKFLVDRNGMPYKRYAPQDPPESIRKDIEALLSTSD